VIAVMMRAVAYYNRACGRVPLDVCIQRAQLALRLEQRA
jgi:hypothetical protein